MKKTKKLKTAMKNLKTRTTDHQDHELNRGTGTKLT